MSERGQNDVNPGGRRDDALHTAALRLRCRQELRSSAALRELAEPHPVSLSDRQRIGVKRLSQQLFAEIEDELRGAILADAARAPNDSLEASLGAAHVPIALPILQRAGLFPDARIVALALERSDMHEAGTRLRGAGPAGDRLDALIGQADEPRSSAAMALLIAESRANLRFEEPRLPPSDVPADLREDLIWRIAAVLRHYAVTYHGGIAGDMDAVLAAAADRLCASTEADLGLFDAAARLAGSLQTTDPALLREALAGGRLALYCGLVGAFSDIAAEFVWPILEDPDGAGHALLLCAAGIDRETGAELVMALRSAMDDGDRGIDDSPAWLDVWETYDQAAAHAALDIWRKPSAYRDALAAISEEPAR